jgi:hypothetical protein
MYKRYRGLKIPEDETKIWRFMDFTKFVSLLDKEALFFVAADKLLDQFEGSSPKPTVESRSQEKLGGLFGGITYSKLTEEAFKNFRQLMYINSWHLNNYESAAMWELYLKSDEGIAIQSTVRKLKDSFKNTKEDISIGKIKYIDYKKDTIAESLRGSPMGPYFFKRKSFAHEQELRALYTSLSEPYKEEPNPPGLYIKIDIDTLIDNVYVSPMAEQWFYDLVTSVVKKFNVSKNVKQSSISSDSPLF